MAYLSQAAYLYELLMIVQFSARIVRDKNKDHFLWRKYLEIYFLGSSCWRTAWAHLIVWTLVFVARHHYSDATVFQDFSNYFDEYSHIQWK